MDRSEKVRRYLLTDCAQQLEEKEAVETRRVVMPLTGKEIDRRRGPFGLDK